MNSRKNSYGTAASPLFPRFPLNPRSTIFVSYSLPPFLPLPAPASLFDRIFRVANALCFLVAWERVQKEIRRTESVAPLVPGNLDRPRDFSPARRGEGRNELSPKRINEGALSLSRRVEVNGRQTTSPEQASRAAALCLRGRKRGGILRADKISCPLLASMLAG